MPPRRAATVFIFGTVLLDVLGFGLIIPVLPKLVEQFMAGDTATAATIYGYFGVAWALMQFLMAPVLGMLSDRFGRRPVILLSCFGMGLDYIFMALAPSLTWLFLGRIISGATAASFSVASAYIADVTTPENRAKSFGLIGAAWGLGFIIGPVAGGLLASIDPRWPFWAAAGFSLANALYGYFVLPESLPPERRSPLRLAKANPIGALQLLRREPRLLGLSGVYFLFQLTHYVFPSVFVLYAGYRYGWSSTDIGWVMMAVGICGVLVQAVLVRHIVRWIGERRALMFGIVAGTAGLIAYGWADTGWLFIAAIPLCSLMGLVGPNLQAFMTTRVRPEEQGRLQGANASIMGISGILAPAFFSQALALGIAGTGLLPMVGAPFYLAAALFVVAGYLAYRHAHPVAIAASVATAN